MDGLWNLIMIHFLDFYFTLLYIAGTYRRFGQYQSIGKLAALE